MRIRFLFVLLFFVVQQPGNAQTYTWNGGSGNWSDSNWSVSSGSGFPNAPGVIAQFAGTADATTSQTLVGVTVGTIRLGGSSDVKWTVNGTGGITLNGGGNGAVISNTNTGTTNALFLNAPALTLADNLLISNTGGSTNGTGAIQITSVIGGTGNLTLSNVNTGLTQAGSIRIQAATNTFTGSVLIQKGTVTYNNGAAFGNAANVITLGQSGQGSAALINSGSLTVANNFVIASGTGGTVTLGGTSSTATNIFSGNVLLNGDLSILSGGSYTFGGILSGAGGISKTDNGAAVLTNANTYSGTTVVSTGTLRLGAGGSINSTSSITVQTGATFDVAPLGNGYTLGSSATQTLQGTGTVTGAVTVANNGTIRGDSGTGTGTLTTGSLTVQSGGRLGVQLGTGTAASSLNTSAGVLNLNSGAVIDPNGSFDGGGNRVLATLASGSGGLVVGSTTYNSAADIASYTYQTGDTGLKAFGALQIDVTGLNLANGDHLVLSRNGSNQLVLNFSPVPEPASMLAVCGLAVGGMVAVRRLRRKGTPVDVTPAV